MIEKKNCVSKRIRIIYLVVSSSVDGSNIALLNLLELIAPKEVEPIVVMPGKGRLSEMLVERKIQYKQIKYYYSVYPKFKTIRDIILFIPILMRTLVFNKIAEKRLIQMARNFKAEIIHTNIGLLHVGYKVAKKLNIPHVWHIREYQDLNCGCLPLFTKNGFIKKICSKKNYPISITKGLYNHYKMKSNAKVIYDGVKKKSQEQFVPKKEKYFLFVGRLEEAKGIRELIAAFVEFAQQEKEYKLLVAGEGADAFKTTMSKMVTRARMGERIVFLGFRSDINDLMARATALVVPSKYEGFGFTTVEAMFNGCLVIGKNSGGTKEILGPDNLGILYNENSELVAIFHELVRSGIESHFSTILKAQKVASKLYSCESHSNEVLKLYNNVKCSL